MGKRNWLVGMLNIIPDSALMDMFKAARILSLSDGSDYAMVRGQPRVIASNITTHVLTPGALWSKCESPEDKVTLFIFMLTFILSGAALVEAFERFVAFCTDLGTEIGFADSMNLGVHILAPSQRVLEEDDGGLGRNGDAGQDSPGEPAKVFVKAFPVAGLDRIVSNATI